MSTKNKARVLLAGGGHTHALLLKALQKKSLPQSQLTLISASRFTPYSGMLPGVIAGNYHAEEAHIDLQILAEQSGCEFIEDRIIALDSDTKTLFSEKGQQYAYDLLSINTGSTQSKVIDANACISIKPIAPFLRWLTQELPQKLQEAQSFNLVIIGAGAAGVEVALAIKKRFHPLKNLNIHIITASGVLSGHPEGVRKMVEEELARKSIHVHKQFKVSGIAQQELMSQQGERLNYDQLILATPATPAAWPGESTLASNSGGFIRVNEYLQSVSHDNVFACGDIAEFTGSPLAKCGVYAVRQAPILHENLIRMLQSQPLKPFSPQKQFLSLLSCADGRAIASKGWFRAKGSMVWHWKDRIDRRFMAQFPMPEPGTMKL